MAGWHDEVDLDPGSTWRRMATRALGERPWLVGDERRDDELQLKARLLAERRDDVLVVPSGTAAAARAVERLVRSEPPVAASGGQRSGVTAAEPQDTRPERDGDDTDPLARAALRVQEDLCLLRRHDAGWRLEAACVCFPSRWRLADKVGRPLVEVHQPTAGYEEHLAKKVDRLLDRLTGRPVLRRNWFVHPDPALHQPDPDPADPVIPSRAVATHLHLRSERQNLRRVPVEDPDDRWVLFTIRVQHDPLGVALGDPTWRERFAGYVAHAPIDELVHRGMGDEQVGELAVHLGVARADRESDTTSDS